MTPDERDLEARMARLRQAAGPAAFGPGFADRVMARLERPSTLTAGLQAVFLRLAPLAAAAVVALSVVNLAATRASGQPFLDRVLRLPAVTLAEAFSLETGIAIASEVQR